MVAFSDLPEQLLNRQYFWLHLIKMFFTSHQASPLRVNEVFTAHSGMYCFRKVFPSYFVFPNLYFCSLVVDSGRINEFPKSLFLFFSGRQW